MAVTTSAKTPAPSTSLLLTARTIRITMSAAAIVLLQLTVGCSSPSAAEWPQWRGPTRNGIAGDSPAIADAWPEDGPRQLWQSEPLSKEVKEGGAGGYGSVVVADGRAYLFVNRKAEPSGEDDSQPEVTAADFVVCFDAETGDEIWKVEYPGKPRHWGTSNTPAIADGRCYAIDSLGHIHCLDAADGSEIWTVKPGSDEISSSVEIIDGKVISMCSPLTALDPAGGDILWQQPEVAARDSSTCVWRHGGQAFVICNDETKKKTICVNTADGSVVWSTKGGGKSTAVVAGDTMVVMTPDQLATYTLTLDGPQLLWENAELLDRSESPLIYNGHVYHVGRRGNSKAICLELSTGKIVWEGDLEDTEIASPIIVDNKIIAVLNYGNKLAMFNAAPEKYELLAKVDTSLLAAASPAVADGKLYVRTSHGVACYDLVRPGGEESE